MIFDTRVHYLLGLKNYTTQSRNDDASLQNEAAKWRNFNDTLVDTQQQLNLPENVDFQRIVFTWHV